MAGYAARFSRWHRSQRYALRLPDPVAEAPQPDEAGTWPPLGAAGPRARLYGRSAAEFRCTRRRAVGAARRRSRDRLGLSATDAGLCRGDRLSVIRDGAEPLRGRRFWGALRRYRQ